MNEALSLLLAPPSQIPATATVPLDAVTILQAIVLDGPDIFLAAARPVQINGALLNVTKDGQVDLKTAAGPMKLSLPVTADMQNVLGNLLGAAEGKRTVVVLFQPSKTFQNEQPKVALLVPTEAQGLKVPDKGPASPPGFALLPSDSASPIVPGQKLTLTLMPQAHAAQKDIASQPMQTEPGQTMQVMTEGHARPSILGSQAQEKTLLARAASGLHEAAVQVEKIVKPGQAFPPMTNENIKAEVVEKSQSGHLLLKIEDKTFFVREKTDVPVGTKLVLSVQQHPAASEDFVLPSGREWPALREIAAALAQSAPDIAKVFHDTKVPSPVSSMAATTLFFLSALQAGKLDEWMGAPVFSALTKAGKKELAVKFIDDAASAIKTMVDDRAGEWKAWPLPVHLGETFDMLRLYVRQDLDSGGKDASHREIKKTHFLITMDLSRLGPLQVEGFARPRRLDLVLRSERALHETLEGSIKADYLRTMAALDFAGTVSFQSGRKDWIVMKEEGIGDRAV